MFGCSLCERASEEEDMGMDPGSDGDQDDGSDGPGLSLVRDARGPGDGCTRCANGYCCGGGCGCSCK